MGMASKAPFDTYTRKCFITDHAVQRLRERLRIEGKIEHRGDEDLRNLLDDTVVDAMAQGTAKASVDTKGDKCWLVPLDSEFEGLIALVKPEQNGKMKWAVVTILEEQWVAKRMLQGTFGTTSKTSFGDVFGEKLEALRVDAGEMPPPEAKAVDQRAMPPVEKVPVRPTAPATVITSAKVDPEFAKEVETRLVTFESTTGTENHLEFPLSTVSQRVNDLLSNPTVKGDTLRVWKPVKMKRIVEIE